MYRLVTSLNVYATLQGDSNFLKYKNKNSGFRKFIGIFIKAHD
jgi:hypothetical protein